MRAAQRDQAFGEREQRALLRIQVPVVVADLVVLTVRVVVAALSPADLVASEQHRRALSQKQRGQQIARALSAELSNGGVRRLALDARVPRSIVVGTVAAVLAVRFVVFAI